MRRNKISEIFVFVHQFIEGSKSGHDSVFQEQDLICFEFYIQVGQRQGKRRERERGAQKRPK
jgi:hypothetical protein